MKSTLADNRQMFNVKDIAYATKIEDLAEGQFGIFAEGSNTSIAATVDTFAELPEKFNIISKLGGKTYYSFDTIEKSKIRNITQMDYVAEVPNVWSTVIRHCECIEGFQVNIGADEDSLIRRDGLTWTHRDFIVGVSAEEIDCQCADGVLQGRDNNVLTRMAVEKINAVNSPYYEAAMGADITDVVTYADATARDEDVLAPVAGDMALLTAPGELSVYDGADWVSAGSLDGEITDMDAFLEALAAANANANPADDIFVRLIIKGKVQSATLYQDIDVNYVYPRGVRLHPSLVLNETKAIAFEEDQALVYEQGAGYDLRAEEWDVMNYYTTLNYYTRLSDGITAKGVQYQFENGVNYDVVNFEFTTDKVETNNGDKRLFGVTLGAIAGSTESADLEDLFTT